MSIRESWGSISRMTEIVLGQKYQAQTSSWLGMIPFSIWKFINVSLTLSKFPSTSQEYSSISFSNCWRSRTWVSDESGATLRLSYATPVVSGNPRVILELGTTIFHFTVLFPHLKALSSPASPYQSHISILSWLYHRSHAFTIAHPLSATSPIPYHLK